MRKPFENKKHYDAGRLRHKIEFVLEAGTDDGFGGTIVEDSTVLTTWAGRDKFNQFNPMVIQAGITAFDEGYNFVIRNRNDFFPLKTMKVRYKGGLYTIMGEPMRLDDPCTFIQVLCVRSK